MASQAIRWILGFLCVTGVTSDGCSCPQATVLDWFPSEVTPEACCLNFSGSSFGVVLWTAFSAAADLEVLDMSDSNVTRLVGEGAPAALREVYLGGNRLRELPAGFLVNASQLRVLDLTGNCLESLPDGFLRDSVLLRDLRVGSNRLSAIPDTVLLPGLIRLDLSQNPWECSCSLVETLRGHPNGTDWHDLVGNLTCSSPRSLEGRDLWSIRRREACWSAGLTALFILLPLLLLLALVLCWCCGRKRKKKEGNFSLAKRASWSPSVSRNGSHGEWRIGAGESSAGVLVCNRLMLQPASALLGSGRDLYEEVEICSGSRRSLAGTCQEGPDVTPEAARRESHAEKTVKADPETVSVTEVLKDSADREKAYLTQSTEYYNLVPGIDLEDSDHGEYENVDLS